MQPHFSSRSQYQLRSSTISSHLHLNRRQLLIWLGLGTFASTLACQRSGLGKNPLPFNSAVIDEAVAASLVRWKFSPSVDTEYRAYNVLHTGKAMNYLALVAHYYPAARASNGKALTKRLLAHIRHVISGGKEPMCRGVIAGWADNSLAQSLTLAKQTPAVWQQLSAKEKEKCDWLMRALAISGNWCQNWANQVHTGLAQAYNWRKHWNPNHQEGYVGVMIAAHLYFGGAETVNQILADFSYDVYMAQFQKFGFTNIQRCWQNTGKTLMEKGGEDKKGGLSRGVRLPFTLEQQPQNGIKVPYEPLALYAALSAWMYAHVVTNASRSGRAHILEGSTPVLGKFGMCYEFQATDMRGERSSARYAYDGWCNNVLTRATLEALGAWGKGKIQQEIATNMAVGSTDLIYKLQQGYLGRANGKLTHHDVSSVDALGYPFIAGIWEYLDRLHPIDLAGLDRTDLPESSSGRSSDATRPDSIEPIPTNLATDLPIQILQPDLNIGSALSSGQIVWRDRPYTYTQVPKLVAGLPFIQTPKQAADNKVSNWLVLTADRPVTLYVAYVWGPTDWLATWTDTGEVLRTSNGKPMRLFSKSFPAGEITLPGNQADPNHQSTWTYTVILRLQ